jgi:hypothetical protein
MNTRMKKCPLCGQLVPELLYDLHRSVDDMIVSRMKRDFPGWSEEDGVCGPCLGRYTGAKNHQWIHGVRFSPAAKTSIWIPV